MRQPVIVQHSFGDPGSGGPVEALRRVLESRLADRYQFVRMHQASAAKGVDINLLRAWVMLLRQVKPDLVHVRGLGNEGFHGALAARLAGCPRVLVSVHGTVRDLVTIPNSIRLGVLTHVIEPCTLRLATHIATVCHSTSQRDFLLKFREKFVGVVPNGVDLPDQRRPMRSLLRGELGVQENHTVLILVGRLSLEKGHLILADALRRLNDWVRQITLILVGDGPDRLIIEATYRDVDGLTFHFLGTRMDVPAVLDASDIFVFPTLHENLSIALLEGMSAGLPIIASAVGGNVEVLERGGGILVPVSDPDALADALNRMLSEPELRSHHAAEGRRTIEEHYTTAHMVNSLDRVYDSIIQERGYK